MSKFCEQCGNPLSDDSKFCEKCGAKQSTVTVTANPGMSPIQPLQPGQSVAPMQPQTIKPVAPMQPVSPMQPLQPVQPAQPIRPIQPQPVKPITPLQPVQSAGQGTPLQPIQPMQPVTPVQSGSNRLSMGTKPSIPSGVQNAGVNLQYAFNNASGATAPSNQHGDYAFRKGGSLLENIIANFFKPENRLNRKPFAIRMGIVFLAGIIANSLMASADTSALFAALGVIIVIAVLIAYIQLSISRLHDLGKGNGMLALHITGLLIFYLLFAKGTTGNNVYGSDPLR